MNWKELSKSGRASLLLGAALLLVGCSDTPVNVSQQVTSDAKTRSGESSIDLRLCAAECTTGRGHVHPRDCFVLGSCSPPKAGAAAPPPPAVAEQRQGCVEVTSTVLDFDTKINAQADTATAAAREAKSSWETKLDAAVEQAVDVSADIPVSEKVNVKASAKRGIKSAFQTSYQTEESQKVSNAANQAASQAITLAAATTGRPSCGRAIKDTLSLKVSYTATVVSTVQITGTVENPNYVAPVTLTLTPNVEGRLLQERTDVGCNCKPVRETQEEPRRPPLETHPRTPQTDPQHPGASQPAPAGSGGESSSNPPPTNPPASGTGSSGTAITNRPGPGIFFTARPGEECYYYRFVDDGQQHKSSGWKQSRRDAEGEPPGASVFRNLTDDELRNMNQARARLRGTRSVVVRIPCSALAANGANFTTSPGAETGWPAPGKAKHGVVNGDPPNNNRAGYNGTVAAKLAAADSTVRSDDP